MTDRPPFDAAPRVCSCIKRSSPGAVVRVRWRPRRRPTVLPEAPRAASAHCRKNAIATVECQATGPSTSGSSLQFCHSPAVM